MAVKEESLHHATEALILPNPRLYYQADIRTRHWQLKSLVSSPEHGVVYYPSGSNIYALYTKTREREIITTLPFQPLCLTVAGGWLCCGGHYGNYATVCLAESRHQTDFSADFNAEADARLSLDLDPIRRLALLDLPTEPSRSRSLEYPLLAKVKKVGLEDKESENAINNSIALWFPPSFATSHRVHKKPVALLANNDCSVYILDLEDSEVLQRIAYPDCVNRAAVSPDGEILAAVLDDPFLYIHQRKKTSEASPGLFNTKDTYKWAPSCRIQLEGQTQTDKSEMKGSFAMSFSSSGKFLAVATQYGIIIVFEVQTLTQEDSEPIVVFTSSRPNSESRDGAVRSLEFAPGPVDLLAWTETTGRVGVADIRDNFHSRQVLSINSHADSVQRVPVSTRVRSEHSPIDPRLRTRRTESPSSNSTTPDYLGLDFERRQMRNLTREMSDRHHSPLTSEDLEVLHAHRIARRQRDALADSASTLSSLRDYTRSRRNREFGASEWRSNLEQQLSRYGEAGPPLAPLRDFLNPDHGTAASFRSFINERNQDRERRNQLQESLSRSATLLAEAAAGGTATRRAASTNLDRRSSPPPAAATDSSSSSNPRAEIDALYRSRAGSGESETLDRAARIRVDLEDDDRREFAHRLGRRWQPFGEPGSGGDEYTVIFRGVPRLRHDDEEGLLTQTTGLSWSPDGRILYAGAEDGIYEFHVNITARKMFPSLVLR